MSDTSDSGTAKTPRDALVRAIIILLVLSLFCVVTLAGPMDHMIAADAEVKLPYLGFEISLASFLIFGPVSVIGVNIYIHILIERIHRQKDGGLGIGLAEKTSMDSIAARWASWLTCYLLTPAVLIIFFVRGLPRPEATVLLGAFVVTTILNAGLVLRREVFPSKARTIDYAWQALAVLAVLVLYQHGTKPRDVVLPYFELDLVQADFTESDLRGANLSRSRLQDAKLTKANLQRANLQHANLTYADLTSANLRAAKMDNATFDHAIMREAKIIPIWTEGKADRPSLRRAVLRHASLEAAILHNADLTEARLNFARLHGAQMENVIMPRAYVIDAVLEGAVLNNANLSNARIIRSSFKQAYLQNADLSGVRLKDSTFVAAIMNKLKLTGATIVNSRFDFTPVGFGLDDKQIQTASLDVGQTLSASSNTGNRSANGARTNGANRQPTNLANCPIETASVKVLSSGLRKADLSGARITNSVFLEGNLSETVFSGSTLTEVSFAGSNLEDSRFDGATFNGRINLSDTNLSNVDLTPLASQGNDIEELTLDRTCFKNANLSGLDLSGLNLKDTLFSGATIDGAIFYEADLTGTDLSKLDLSKLGLPSDVGAVDNKRSVFGPSPKLDNARLIRSVVRGLDLTGASLRKARLSGSDLSKTVLRGADFREAFMLSTDLTDAALQDAKFGQSRLRNANFTDADVAGANFAGAKGLTCRQISAAKNCQLALGLPAGCDCRAGKALP